MKFVESLVPTILDRSSSFLPSSLSWLTSFSSSLMSTVPHFISTSNVIINEFLLLFIFFVAALYLILKYPSPTFYSSFDRHTTNSGGRKMSKTYARNTLNKKGCFSFYNKRHNNKVFFL